MESERMCFNCKHWEIDPSALDKRHQILAKMLASVVSSDENNRAVLAMYGQCKATYLDENGQDAPGTMFNIGMMGGFKCECKDSQGKLLFEPVPEGT